MSFSLKLKKSRNRTAQSLQQVARRRRHVKNPCLWAWNKEQQPATPHANCF